MSGRIKQLIDKLVKEKSKGNQSIVHAANAMLILKGVNISKYNENSDDNPEIINKLQKIAEEWGVTI